MLSIRQPPPPTGFSGYLVAVRCWLCGASRCPRSFGTRRLFQSRPARSRKQPRRPTDLEQCARPETAPLAGGGRAARCLFRQRTKAHLICVVGLSGEHWEERRRSPLHTHIGTQTALPGLARATAPERSPSLRGFLCLRLEERAALQDLNARPGEEFCVRSLLSTWETQTQRQHQARQHTKVPARPSPPHAIRVYGLPPPTQSRANDALRGVI